MKVRRVMRAAGVAIAVAGVFLMRSSLAGQVRANASQPAAATPKRSTAPVTPYGDPDLQGVWLNNSATPLQRPDALKDRTRLADEEVAELQRRADRLFNEPKTDAALGDAVF